ncbi:MAG: hypothetical protein R3321_06300 [Nitrososphaeraceae archaeon]|nr:hypothetical protein [Nitrososphaeraceae archaeon]
MDLTVFKNEKGSITVDSFYTITVYSHSSKLIKYLDYRLLFIFCVSKTTWITRNGLYAITFCAVYKSNQKLYQKMFDLAKELLETYKG